MKATQVGTESKAMSNALAGVKRNRMDIVMAQVDREKKTGKSTGVVPLPLPMDLSKYNTEQLHRELIKLLDAAQAQHFAPLNNTGAIGDVDLEIITDIHRVTAELTAHYLLMGF